MKLEELKNTYGNIEVDEQAFLKAAGIENGEEVADKKKITDAIENLKDDVRDLRNDIKDRKEQGCMCIFFIILLAIAVLVMAIFRF